MSRHPAFRRDAAGFTRRLGSPVVEMLDGFNEGWIRYEQDDPKVIKGVVPVDTVLKELTARSA